MALAVSFLADSLARFWRSQFLQFEDQRPAALIAHAHALLRRHPVDLALDGEQGIDALDRFDRDRCLLEPGEIKELAPREHMGVEQRDQRRQRGRRGAHPPSRRASRHRAQRLRARK
jgi:hypothetical protein